MDKYIKYFYDLSIDEYIIKEKTSTVFRSDNNYYLFKECNNLHFMEVLNQCALLDKEKELFLKYIPNNKKELFTIINEHNYILFKVPTNYLNFLTVDDLIKYEKINNIIRPLTNKINWSSLWENKTDYYEKIINENKELLLYDEFGHIYNYFLGLCENAVLYYKNAIRDNTITDFDYISIQHKRIRKNTHLYEIYDPSELVIDYYYRDFCEFFKSEALYNKYNFKNMDLLLNNKKYTKTTIKKIYSRMLFPSYFFDCLDAFFITGNYDNIYYMSRVANNYSIFIKKISTYLKNKYNISVITWIIDN